MELLNNSMVNSATKPNGKSILFLRALPLLALQIKPTNVCRFVKSSACSETVIRDSQDRSYPLPKLKDVSTQ